jgi:cell pole-organizing protein PopZ
MEEILSSIRRIIADEEAGDATAGDDELGAAEARAEALDENAEALAQAADEDQDGDEDVLELTKVVRESGEVVDFQSERSAADESMEEIAPAMPAFAQGGDDRERALANRGWGDASEDEPKRKDKAVRREQARATELMSTTAATAATGAFAKLSQAVQRTPAEESVADASGRSVEQFIEDIVRPMLKAWLDQHLPPIVERLVEKEIQKISRRAELD